MKPNFRHMPARGRRDPLFDRSFGIAVTDESDRICLRRMYRLARVRSSAPIARAVIVTALFIGTRAQVAS